MPVEDVNFAPRSREVTAELSRLNRSRAEPLSKFQLKQIADAKPIYIYNVSTIYQWDRFQGQLGTVRIPKCEVGEKLSKPYVMKGVITRWYDQGFGRKKAFMESGMEVAEDICGCSKEYPVESPNNNLTNFGVFITEKPFEELSQREQDRLLSAANAKLMERLRNNILEADRFHVVPTQRSWIGEMHIASLVALNEIEGTKETRPWAPMRGAEKTEDCKFCGAKVKPGFPVCTSCHHILDQEKYDKMQAKKAS